jgi:hypothetical protein
MRSEEEVYLVGRNDLCPCGSGLKFKKCCLLKPAGPGTRTAGKFHFEPGSYGGPGGYMPSLACFTEASPGRKVYQFILANTTHIAGSEDEAVAQATSDFREACRVDDATGSIEAMGHQLAARGYVNVKDFKVILDDA